MRNLILFTIILALVFSCSSTLKRSTTTKETLQNKAVRIANDSLEYEIIIIDIGFEFYLNSIAKPANFYSQSYYESKNKFYVTTWNSRAQNPLRYNNNIYENVIDYNFTTNYGLDVNYKLYNYFKFVEYKYKEVF